MRALPLLLAACAAGFVAGYLVGSGRESPGRREAGRAPLPETPEAGGSTAGRSTPPRPPDVSFAPPDVRRAPQSPRTQKDLAAFVVGLAARGSAAVPEILAFLRSGEDVELRKVWSFEQGELRDYPTLRSAYLEALRRISGGDSDRALRELFPTARSLEESYCIALALSERGDGSWTDSLAQRVGAAAEPARLGLQTAMVELAARTDPVGTARQVEVSAPRGEDGTDPQPLAAALRALPLDAARATAERLLGDAAVTPRAKGRYLDSIFRRGEPEIFDSVRSLLAGGALAGDLAVTAANAAVNSYGFVEDIQEIHRARADRDGAAEQLALARFGRRIEAARALVGAAFAVDPGNTQDARALSCLRMLEAHEGNAAPPR